MQYDALDLDYLGKIKSDSVDFKEIYENLRVNYSLPV